MSDQPTVFLSHLPEVYQTSSGHFDKLLLAFQALLLTGSDELQHGQDINNWLGLEQKIASIHSLFNPKSGNKGADNRIAETPTAFLPWIASWVALSQQHLLSEEQSRNAITKIVPLYAYRGTSKYLSAILEIFFPEVTSIIHDKEMPTLKVGYSKVGNETRLGGDIPFYFYITVRFSKNEEDIDQLTQLKANIRSVIDLAKPAYTDYHIEYEYQPKIQKTSMTKNEYLP